MTSLFGKHSNLGTNFKTCGMSWIVVSFALLSSTQKRILKCGVVPALINTSVTALPVVVSGNKAGNGKRPEEITAPAAYTIVVDNVLADFALALYHAHACTPTQVLHAAWQQKRHLCGLVGSFDTRMRMPW